MARAATVTILRKVCGSLLVFSLAQTLAWGQTSSLQTEKSFAKLAPILQTVDTRPLASPVRVQVKNNLVFRAWLRSSLPQAVVQPMSGVGATWLVSNLSSSGLQVLTRSPLVSFIDVGNRVPQEEAYLQNSDLRVNHVEAVHRRFPQWTGQGLTISIKENPFDPADIDLKGRVLPNSASGKAPSMHATSMATLAAGGGNSAPEGKGVAWQSHIISSDFSNLMPDETSFLRAKKVSVQNHSYGVGLENYYGLESQAYDAQVREYPELLHVFSSGNAGTQTPGTGPYAGIAGFANLTGQFKVSKNTLAVGAIDTSGQVSARSSRGPTFDGRIKPEVVAFGESGSSEASAVVSGVALLLQQAYQTQHSGALPSSALLKAVLINSADDKGAPEVDYASGFGNVNALAALNTLQDNRYFSGSVAQGTTQKFGLTVPAGVKKIKVTVAWIDPAANPADHEALVHDLDLVLVEKSTGRTWLPWGLSAYPHKDSLLLPSRRQIDRRNNVEHVSIAAPAAGTYEVRVSGFKIAEGNQSFSLAYAFEEGFSWSYPSEGSVLKSGQVNRLYWQVPQPVADKARLEFRWEGQNWQPVAENVSFGAGFFNWRAPDGAGVAQVRLVATNGQGLYNSGSFILSPDLSLEVGYSCGEETMLFWSGVKGVTHYQVYALGDKFLEKVAVVTDTLFIFPKDQSPALHYAVAPLFHGQPGQRSLTVNYLEQGAPCYVRQFLARQRVTDSVLFDVEFSTLHGLKDVLLERKEKGGFKELNSLWPLPGHNLLVTDARPVSGRNDYRLKLITQKGEVFYSETESVFYTPPEFAMVFPNPGVAGEDIQLITLPNGLNTIQIFDKTGKLLREIQQDASIKVISTLGLPAGLYILKISRPSLGVVVTKIFLL